MTREEAIEVLEVHKAHWERLLDNGICDVLEGGNTIQALKVSIQALEQEPVLDKIRAEIEALPKTYPFVNHIDTYIKEDDVRRIIDKYKAESEEE